ncbi:MAG UNVERIFIED_CONTAM: EamA family transporter [Rickettsiaceae bacterium]|jgi:drug/metabolite transporter (DMT)-like permease
MTQTDVINLSLSFIGSLMIIMPGRDIMNIGALLAFCSAILWALSNIIIKKLSETDKTQTQLFYSNIFTFILAFMVAFCNNEHNQYYIRF